MQPAAMSNIFLILLDWHEDLSPTQARIGHRKLNASSRSPSAIPEYAIHDLDKGRFGIYLTPRALETRSGQSRISSDLPKLSGRLSDQLGELGSEAGSVILSEMESGSGSAVENVRGREQEYELSRGG